MADDDPVQVMRDLKDRARSLRETVHSLNEALAGVDTLPEAPKLRELLTASTSLMVTLKNTATSMKAWHGVGQQQETS